ncbi:MAG: hypothetical protein J7639_16140 [Paenibacillaceae bacterium]|nr:hypothetical protein [Paenibacillaceae bacterium]
MREFIILLHVVGSIGMGLYLLLPFLVMRLGTLAKPLQEGYVAMILAANRIGQYLLVVQLLTGGYLISKAGVSSSWIITVLVLFVAAGAVTGIIGKPLKKLKQDGEDSNASVTLAKINTLATLVSVIFLLIVILMVYRDLI